MILLGKVCDFFMRRRLQKIESQLQSAGLLEQAKQLNDDLKEVWRGGFKRILACVDDVMLFNDNEIYAGVESYVLSRVGRVQQDYLERNGLPEQPRQHFLPQPFKRYMRRYDGRVIGCFMLTDIFMFVAGWWFIKLFGVFTLPVMLAGCLLGAFAAWGLLKLVFCVYFGTDDLLKIRDVLFFQAYREYFADLQKDMYTWLENISKNSRLAV